MLDRLRLLKCCGCGLREASWRSHRCLQSSCVQPLCVALLPMIALCSPPRRAAGKKFASGASIVKNAEGKEHIDCQVGG